jgi:uncharacterized protein YerC
MSTITYKNFGDDDDEIKVYSGGLRVGTIRKDGAGYCYQPKGSKARGESFSTISAVKRSLEN